jgi:hypothetical protein
VGAVLALGAALLVTATAAAAHAQQRHWCQSSTSSLWNRVLRRHIVPLSRTTSLVPWTLAHDGQSFFASVYSASFSGVARISATQKTLMRIKSFPDPGNDQADGEFDGRWLVWNEYHGFDDFNDFTVWVWDSRTGRVREIGRATRAPDGRFWTSSWRQPDVRGGIATWAQGAGPDQLAQVHVYDLPTSADRIIRTGHGLDSFLLAGRLVAWPERPLPGARAKMYVASALTGQRVLTPPALRGLRDVFGLVTDGHRIAYPDGLYKSLWWSPSLRAGPRKIVAAGGSDHIDNSVQIGGRYIGFGMQPRLFVGDTKTRRYVQISRRSGYTRLDSKSLLVLYATGSKQLDAVAPIAFVPLRDLPPMPACS